jgi:ATP-dependent DNA helicase RecG
MLRGHRSGRDTPIGASGFAGATTCGGSGRGSGSHGPRPALPPAAALRRPAELSTARELAWIPDGEPASARLQVRAVRVEPTFRRRIQRTTAYLGDDTGEAEATWFGRRFIEKRLREGTWIVISGKVKRRGFTTTLRQPRVPAGRRLGSAARRPDRAGLPAHGGADGDDSPAGDPTGARRGRLDLSGVPAGRSDSSQPPGPPAAGACRIRGHAAPTGRGRPNAHLRGLEKRPLPGDFASPRRRPAPLGFDELLAFQIGMVARDRQRRVAVGEPVEVPGRSVSRAIEAVEAALTEQVRARTGARRAGPLTADQADGRRGDRGRPGRPRPMMRLLQGDVGSGKTAVAALALAFVADAGRQGALLAPTDLLARQHAVALRRLVEPLGHGVTLLTGTLPAAERREALNSSAAPPAARMGCSGSRAAGSSSARTPWSRRRSSSPTSRWPSSTSSTASASPSARRSAPRAARRTCC